MYPLVPLVERYSAPSSGPYLLIFVKAAMVFLDAAMGYSLGQIGTVEGALLLWCGRRCSCRSDLGCRTRSSGPHRSLSTCTRDSCRHARKHARWHGEMISRGTGCRCVWRYGQYRCRIQVRQLIICFVDGNDFEGRLSSYTSADGYVAESNQHFTVFFAIESDTSLLIVGLRLNHNVERFSSRSRDGF